jgi:hypothetical protein
MEKRFIKVTVVSERKHDLTTFITVDSIETIGVRIRKDTGEKNTVITLKNGNGDIVINESIEAVQEALLEHTIYVAK